MHSSTVATITLSLLLGPLIVLAADAPQLTHHLMFKPPKDWQVIERSSSVLFFDAPNRRPGDVCRISLTRPMNVGSSFVEWFKIVTQEADIVVEESEITAGDGPAGGRKVPSTEVVVRHTSDHPRRREYYGFFSSGKAALMIFTTSEDDLYRAHAAEFDSMVNSWDPTGEFPQAPFEVRPSI